MTASAIQSVAELTPLQEGLIFHNQRGATRDPYCVQTAYRVVGALNLDALRAALDGLQARHAALRTAFVWKSQPEPRQVVRQGVPANFERFDAQALTPTERETLWTKLQQDELLAGFDLQRPPLLRWRVVQVGPAEHWLLKTHHHIVLDGWSSSIVLRDLAALYRSECTGTESGLPNALAFTEYVQWLNGRRSRGRADSDAFWQSHFAGLRGATRMQLPVAAIERGAAEPCVEAVAALSEEQTERLQAAAAAAGLTLNTLVQGAWLHRVSQYSQRRDCVLGVTVAGRPAELLGSEQAVGLFINTLPLRCRVDPAEPLVAFLRKLQSLGAQLSEHAHERLADIQRLMPAAVGREPFDSVVVFENFPRASSNAPHDGALRIEPLGVRDGTHYRLALYVAPGAKLRLRLSVGDPRIALSVADALVQQVVDTLNRLPEGLSAVGRGGPGPRLDWLSTAHGPVQPPRALSREVERLAQATHPLAPWVRTVQRHGQRTALRWADQTLSYVQLGERVARLSEALRRQGIGPGQRVALLLERGPSVPIALLSVLSVGASFVPVDPHYPPQRVQWMLDDCRAHWALCDAPSGALQAPQLPCGAWTLHEGAVVAERRSAEAEPVAPGWRDQAPGDWVPRAVVPRLVAYSIYTSGSTGEPKAVQVGYGALFALLEAMQQQLNLRAADRWFALTSLSFDISLLEQLLPLREGAELQLISQAEARNPTALLNRLRESPRSDAAAAAAAGVGAEMTDRAGSSWLQATPSTLQMLVEADWSQDAPVHVLAGGEALPRPLRDRLLGRSGGPRLARSLRNVYGPTETCVWSTQHLCGEEEEVSIGQPLSGEQLYALDARGAALPAGAEGELCIGGVGLAEGYAGQPALTAERFVPNPRGPAGSRLYRTGDRGRVLQVVGEQSATQAEHWVHLGRMDRQIKLRGHRIELPEVEGALQRLVGVAAAAVVVASGSMPQLVAHWVAAEGGAEPSVAALREQLALQLPGAYLPGRWVRHVRLPQTPNGKVDLQALSLWVDTQADPEPSSSSVSLLGEVGRDYALSVEALISPIWQQLLPGAIVGPDTNFFEAGGHSLLALRLASRASRALGRNVSVQTVFDAPRFGDFVQAAQGTGDEPPMAPPVRAQNPPEVERLSYAQERLWFLEQLQPDSGRYDVAFGLELPQGYSRSALRAALQWLSDRHEVLRSCFFFQNGQAWQRHEAPGQEHFEVLAEGALQDHLAALRRPFAWAGQSPWRVSEWTQPDGSTALYFRFHHLLLDAESLNVLTLDLHRVYRALCRGEAVPAQGESLSYRDWIRWQRSAAQQQALDRALDYFREHLAGAPATTPLPTDYVRGLTSPAAAERVELSLQPSLVADLHSLCAARHVTPFVVFLSTYAMLLSRHCQVDDLVVGVPISGRGFPSLDEVVGPFSNTLALRLNLQGNPRWVQWLESVRGLALTGFEHAGLPFERLVDALGVERSAGREPLLSTLLAVDQSQGGTPVRAGAEEELSWRTLPTQSGPAKFDWLLHLYVSPTGVRGHLEFDPALFRRESIERVVRQFESLLEQAVRAPATPVQSFRLGTPAQVAPRAWDNTRPLEQHAADLSQGWLSMARLHPHAAALQLDEEVLTYAQLVEATASVARALSQHGVGREVLVALCLPRQLRWVVGMLSVLRAGGAYLPIDPDLPDARKQWIAQDAGAHCLLTTPRAWGTSPCPCPALHLTESLAVQPWGRERLGEGRAAAEHPARIDEAAHPEQLAYVLYTSGSTGQPKGVAIAHRQVMRLFEQLQGQFEFSARDVWSVFHSLSFDFSVWEIWGALLYGGTAVLVPQVARTHPVAFAELMERHGVTMLSQTPSAFLAMQGQLLPRRDRLRLRHVVFGGEVLRTEHLNPWWRTLGSAQPPPVFTNMYGITETTVFVSGHTLAEQDTVRPTGSIGGAIGDLSLAVTDRRGEPSALGAVGELCIGGPGLGRGYLGRPSLTAQRFVPDPNGGPGQRRYRSGDLVTLDEGGQLRYLQRLDSQVQLRGYRVELPEVAASVQSHPAVAQVVVRLRGSDDRAQLVGYGRPQLGVDPLPNLRQLRDHQRKWVPSHLLLDAWVWLEQLPLTAHGKLDEAALPPVHSTALTERKRPRSSLERRVADLFGEVLGRSAVGVDESFFELGGNSLLALGLMEGLSRSVGSALPLTALFQAPTVEQLCRLLCDNAEGCSEQVVLNDLGASDRVVHCFHPGGGHVECYKPLAEALRRLDYRCVGWQSRTVFDAEYRDASIAKLAADYAQRLLQHGGGAEARFSLVGWSSGGVLAAAVAERLQQAGATVQLLALVDPPYPPALKAEHSEPESSRSALQQALVGLGADGADPRLQTLDAATFDRWNTAVGEASTPQAARQVALELAQQQGWVSENLTSALCEWRLQTLARAAELLRAHEVKPLSPQTEPGTVHLWQATVSGADRVVSAPSGQWQQLLGVPVAVTALAESHASIVRAPEFFQQLGNVLAETRRRAVTEVTVRSEERKRK